MPAGASTSWGAMGPPPPPPPPQQQQQQQQQHIDGSIAEMHNLISIHSSIEQSCDVVGSLGSVVCRSENLDMLQANSESLSQAASQFHLSSNTPSKSSGGVMTGLFSSISNAFASTKSRATKMMNDEGGIFVGKHFISTEMKNSAPSTSNALSLESSLALRSSSSSDDEECLEVGEATATSLATTTCGGDKLQDLVLLQEFNGAFKLNKALARAVGRPLSELAAAADAFGATLGDGVGPGDVR